MSFSNDNNYNKKKTLDLLGLYLDEANKQQKSFNCELTNSSSIFLKHINIIVFDNKENETQLVDPRNVKTVLDETTASTTTTTGPNGSDWLHHVSYHMRDDYDYDGALSYILIILMWYSIFVMILIILQTKMSDSNDFEYSDDPRDVSARNLLKRMRTEDVKKEALDDLSNPVFKNKIWEIYYGNPHTHKIGRVDSKKTHRISEKKLRQYERQAITAKEAHELAKASAANNNNTIQTQHSNHNSVHSYNNLAFLKALSQLEKECADPSCRSSHNSIQAKSNRTPQSIHHIFGNATPNMNHPATPHQTIHTSPSSHAFRFKVEKLDKDLV